MPRLLDAGITVIGTLHLTSLTSMAQAMGSLLGDHPNGARVDDGILAVADELELVDVTPAVLDERLRRGEVMPPAEAALALQGEFRPEVLATLREATFRLIAEHTDRQLVAYMRDRRIDRPWEARSRVMVCVPPRPHMEGLIRRAARLADSLDAEMRVVTVRTRPRSLPEKEVLGEYATLTHQLGGEFMTLYGRAAAPAIAAYARRTLADRDPPHPRPRPRALVTQHPAPAHPDPLRCRHPRPRQRAGGADQRRAAAERSGHSSRVTSRRQRPDGDLHELVHGEDHVLGEGPVVSGDARPVEGASHGRRSLGRGDPRERPAIARGSIRLESDAPRDAVDPSRAEADLPPGQPEGGPSHTAAPRAPPRPTRRQQ